MRQPVGHMPECPGHETRPIAGEGRETTTLLHSSDRRDPRPSACSLLALALSAALALAGCGGGGGATSTSSSTTTLAGAPAGGTVASTTPGAVTTTAATGTTATAPAGSTGAAISNGGSSHTSAGARPAPAGGSGSSGADRGSSGTNSGGRGGPSGTKHGTGSSGGAAGNSSAAAPGTGGGASGSAPSASSESGVPYRVGTTSMEPTYRPFTTVYYDPTHTHPQLGDVVLFHLPKGATEGACSSVEAGGAACVEPASRELTTTTSMKRVVGLSGDTIAMRDGQVIRNGQPVSESIVGCTGPGCEFPKAITVPAGSYYVMSDNRQLFQEDSRVFGAVPQAAILGTVQR